MRGVLALRIFFIQRTIVSENGQWLDAKSVDYQAFTILART